LSAVLIKQGRRWLYILHRWLGIFTCLLCAVWFVSGVVMMYVPYPGLTDRDRMAFSQAIDWSQVRVSPDQALKAARADKLPGQFRLAMFEGQPVYRLVDGPRRTTVSAVDGRLLGPFDGATALEVVRRLHPEATSAGVTTLFHDQWTVAQGFNPHRPLHKVGLGDRAGTELYVSSQTGEVVDDTTRHERFWNWLGSVPHWIYPTVLRQYGEAWRQVILWTSGPAMIGAAMGVWVGILRLRVKRRYAQGRVSPYRGWMKWHHVSGLIAGLFLTTWLISGWLSVNPFHWFDRAQASPATDRAYAGHDGSPAFAADAAPLHSLPPSDAREARFYYFDGRPVAALMGADLSEALVDARTGQPLRLTDDQVFAAAARTLPGVPMTIRARLTQEDDYWYAHQNERRLPVLRAGFADPAGTWLHIDPTTGEILNRTSASGRVYRWLFNFLHDFDLRFLLHHRPAWDIVVWALSIGGMIVSVSSVVIGWRRLERKFGGKPKPARAKA
jgi:uncharacterized iron-regulated membrane protein